VGPITVKARRPSVVSRCRGTTSCRRLADRKRCRPTTSETGVQQSMRYFGAVPCRHRCINKPSLNVTRSRTVSQCSSAWMSVVRPRSYFLEPLSARAVVLSTCCSLFMTDFYISLCVTIQGPALLLAAVRIRCT